MSSNRTTAEVISNLVETYPNIFKGRAPQFSLSVPPGWGKLVDELCSLFESICSEEQLNGIEICSITLEDGALEFDIACDCDLREDQIKVLKARIFALRSRSMFSCTACGILVKEWAEDGAPVLCKRHAKEKRRLGIARKNM